MDSSYQYASPTPSRPTLSMGNDANSEGNMPNLDALLQQYQGGDGSQGTDHQQSYLDITGDPFREVMMFDRFDRPSQLNPSMGGRPAAGISRQQYASASGGYHMLGGAGFGAGDNVSVPLSFLQALNDRVKANSDNIKTLTEENKAIRAVAEAAAAEAKAAKVALEEAQTSEEGKVGGKTEKKKGKNTARATVIESLVHPAWLKTIGCPARGKNPRNLELPSAREDGSVEPLEEGGSWGIDFSVGANEGNNTKTFDHVIAILDQNKEKEWLALADKDKRAAVTTYYNHLAHRWRTQTDPARMAKEEQRRFNHMMNQRRDRWVEQLGEAMPALINYISEKYGRDYTHGLELVLLESKWYGLAYGDYGKATAEDWNARKVACGGGLEVPGWEVREYAWKSEKLIQLQALLIKLRRQQGKMKNNNFMFPGLAVNIMQGSPEKTDKNPVVYKELVSSAWIEETACLETFAETTDAVSCLRLDLKDEFSEALDRVWLGQEMSSV
ncbi:unnamed protein product [Peniophora sp. CBMAI 1063]|nr:unnamed protein product [Peniophora sp. CBMAI 1063]